MGLFDYIWDGFGSLNDEEVEDLVKTGVIYTPYIPLQISKLRVSKMDSVDIFSKFTSLPWLQENTIYLTRHGSHSYGTNRPESDLDLRGVCIPPLKYFFGVLDNFEQAITNEPYDLTIFGIKKFIYLALENNPNALEIIFTDESDHLFISNIGKELLDIKELFLSKKCRFCFAGYARSQLKRIHRHRRWLLNPIVKKPERSDFGLPDNHKLIPEQQLLLIEAEVQKVVDEWNIDTTGMENDTSIKFKNELYDKLLEMRLNRDDMHMYAARLLGLNDQLFEAFKKERMYKTALREYKDYQTWQVERNRERYELEKKYNYDAKHAMHLVRLYRQCIELLRDGKLNVRRPDAEELLAIRNGAWTYEQLIEWAEEQDKILDELYKTSSLRREPERVKINNWLIETLQKFYGV